MAYAARPEESEHQQHRRHDGHDEVYVARLPPSSHPPAAHVGRLEQSKGNNKNSDKDGSVEDEEEDDEDDESTSRRRLLTPALSSSPPLLPVTLPVVPGSPHQEGISGTSPALIAGTLAAGWLIALFILFPFPTTVHLFLALAVALVAWDIAHLAQLAGHLAHRWRTRHHFGAKQGSLLFPNAWRPRRRFAVGLATVLSVLVLVGTIPRRHPAPRQLEVMHAAASAPNERFFIAANMYNAADGVLSTFMRELTKLAQFLGPSNVFISIAESNSKDGTKPLLTAYGHDLDSLHIPNLISLEDNKDRWWPYGTSPERVTYLAGVRNKALAPLQSEDNATRLPDAHTYTKVIFLNDIYFSWQDIIQLIATQPTTPPAENDDPDAPPYDLACATDFGHAGLYDTWVARDICGLPLRAFWPYVKSRESVKHVKREEPFEVAACWNGAVVFPAKPYLQPENRTHSSTPERASSKLQGRGWKMMDNATYPHTWNSPALTSPLKFRGASYKDACDHSECFLFSYDLHRLYAGQRRPRIYMNPKIKVAYDHNWYRWQTTVLEMPLVRFWLHIWSRGPPLYLVDWLFELFGRTRDYCTWAGLQTPDYCPPLPGPADRGWSGG